MIPSVAPLPWFLPGIAISVLVSVAVTGRVGRALRIRFAVAFMLVLGLGIIVSATLTPVRWAFDVGVNGVRSCDFSRVGLATLWEYRHLTDTSLNVLLFIPLGAAIALVPWTRRKAALLAGAAALPVAIETIQLLVPWLERGCESADVVDNLTGLVIGLAAGAMIGRFAPAARGDAGGSG